MFQAAFNRLQGVVDELRTVQDALDRRQGDPSCKGTERRLVIEARAQSEKTYLMRLLAEFERVLTLVGPALSSPQVFLPTEGLANKLDRIGAAMGIDASFRQVMDDQIRKHRNELAHGGVSPVPRVGFDASHNLMKSFLRLCR